MLNSGKKFRALCDKKNKYSNSCVVRKKKSERKKKNITSPFKLNGRSLIKAWFHTTQNAGCPLLNLSYKN